MLEKDAAYSKMKSEKMLERHPSLVDSYRAILFDWLSEVAHECKFHRETYHLALDFIDRYLSAQANVGKLQLQLIGTTCLFLAAKFEEIRPPTVSEFADLTDGACRPEDIIDNEVVILSAINWDITPMTPNNWLNVYMQILMNLDKENEDTNAEQTPRKQSNRNNNSRFLKDTNENFTIDENSRSSTSSVVARNDAFMLPASNGIFRSNHKRIASVIDLALLHIESLRFPNSILTASALFHFVDEQTVRQCTGYKYQDLAECIRWLKPFAETIKDIREPVFVACCKGETHSTQMHSHIATAKLLDKVIMKMTDTIKQSLKRKACCLLEEEIVTDSENGSMLSPTKPTTLLTPPRSAKKSRKIR